MTFVTLVADVLTGSRLELDGLLGYDAIVAGRFIGYGNLSFGLLAVSALTVTAAAATALGRRAGPDRARAVTAATVLGVGAPDRRRHRRSGAGPRLRWRARGPARASCCSPCC